MGDLAAIVLREIDVSRSAVEPFDGFVFLCGGPFRDTAPPNPLLSLRHHALRMAAGRSNRIADRSVIVAEHATELLQSGDFGDLLEFENHLAALAACIVIFLESPGAIAELGSFAVMHDVRSKVLVVCEQLFAEPPTSFIQLGPIASLRKRDPLSVHTYPFHDNGPDGIRVSEALVDECWADLEQGITDFAKRAVRGSAFDAAELPHQLILMLELVTLFTAMRLTEISACLAVFGCKLSKAHLTRSLKMLVKFNLLAVRHWGHEQFYVRNDAAQFMTLKRQPPDARPFDRLRFISDRLDEYVRDDAKKSRALKSLHAVKRAR